MRIAVCVKQVPDTTELRIDPATNTLIREGVAAILNPLDEFAVEEAVRLKERFGGEVVIFSMGPGQAEQALRKALAFGADQALLLCDRAFAGSDTWATSLTLAAALRKLGPFDLILCGKQAIDGDTAQVGPGIAAHLAIPQVTYVKRIVEVRDGCMRVERLIEDGQEEIEVRLPALMTVLKEINQPRPPSLMGWLFAQQATMTRLKAQDLGLPAESVGLRGSPTSVNRISTPPRRASGVRLTGSPEDIASQLGAAMRRRGLVRTNKTSTEYTKHAET